jgi:two-component system, sensor histidine kinase
MSGISLHASPELSAALERSIVDERIRIVLRSGSRTPLTAAVATLALAVGLSYSEGANRYVASNTLIWWVSVMLAFHCAGAIWAGLFTRGRVLSSSPRRAVAVYLAHGVAVGLGWASAVWLFLPFASAGAQVLLVTTMTAVLSGGVATQATYAPAARSFGFALSLAAAGGLIRLGGTYYFVVAAGLMILCFHVLVASRAVEAAVTKSIRLSLLNDSLRARETALREAADSLRADAELARERAERAQRDAERERESAMRADRGKAMVIAATSHDLRQPLHALVQYTAHLRRDLGPVEQAHTVARVEDSVSVLQGLLDEVLEFSEFSDSRAVAVAEPVNLPALVQQIATMIRPDADKKELVLQLECADVTVLLDRRRLSRAMQNLAQNAVRYTNSGTITLRVTDATSCVRLLVADTGIGIESSDKEWIFEEYYQIGNRGRSRHLGSGLGLAIVRNVATAMGLQVRLKSKPGVGSVFALEIPVSKVIARELSVAPDLVPGATLGGTNYVRGAHVLLIDDDALARESLALTLAAFGCRVTTAASAVDALAKLADEERIPQIILSDYRLADGDTGLDAIALLRAYFAELCGGEVALISMLISGDTSPETASRVAQAGYRLLAKPLAADVLHRALHEALRLLELQPPNSEAA